VRRSLSQLAALNEQDIECLAAANRLQTVTAATPLDRGAEVPVKIAHGGNRRQPTGKSRPRITGKSARVDDIVMPAETDAIIAYHIPFQPKLPLVPAPTRREWMEHTPEHFAMRCLPMLLANQAGWWLLNDHPLQVTWDGSNDPDGLRLEWLGDERGMAISNFGFGILTWNTPYLFRTPPGTNLHVRGPANHPRDGMFALEGVVETDWTMATFTINWKVTRANKALLFERGDPICQLVPVRRGELETYTPRQRSLEDAPELKAGYEAWRDSRWAFQHQELDSACIDAGWQKHYFRGQEVDGHVAPRGAHQLKLVLRGFS
jgi:hypothetical protein